MVFDVAVKCIRWHMLWLAGHCEDALLWNGVKILGRMSRALHMRSAKS